MRIALIRARYTPFGGAERFVERALAALRDSARAQLTLICREWAGAERLAEDRIVVCDPPYGVLPSRRTARDRSFAACVQARIAEGGYDIVQSHERIPGCMIYRAGDGVHAAWIDALGRVRGVAGRLALRLDPYHRYVLDAEREMLAHPGLRAVICNSLMVREQLVRHYAVPAEKLHVIPNAVDLERFHPRVKQWRADVRTRLDLPAQAPLALFVGSGFERKGVARLLRAAARVAGLRVLVVGGDRHLPRYRRLATRLGLGERAIFSGPQREVAGYYGAADVFCLPTLYDPCPNAALEALACALPVLTTTSCGARDFIREGVNGALVDALDIDTLAARLGELCEPGVARGMADAARASVSGLTAQALAGRLIALYERILGPANARVQ